MRVSSVAFVGLLMTITTLFLASLAAVLVTACLCKTQAALDILEQQNHGLSDRIRGEQVL